MEKAIVKRVIGPVVDVHFPEGQLPELYHAVEVHLPERKVVMEVVQQIGGGDARCIALSSTDGISRGCEAVNTGSAITMPVGEATLGRRYTSDQCIHPSPTCRACRRSQALSWNRDYGLSAVHCIRSLSGSGSCVPEHPGHMPHREDRCHDGYMPPAESHAPR